ncbi:hypothetical protein ACIO87_14430 [Streptomyces sp. NPDC087218]|uniref:hypothetical protein n=1 Tax=Streptomyces sp. NPDC087218 TaxID=3365769 RepID=UPI00380D3F5D
MRPVRPVTGTAASAVTIATLGLFIAGPTAYAGDTEALRTGSASALSRTAEEPVTQPADEEGADETVAGPGADAQFGLDAPSLLDSAGGLDALSGLGLPGVHNNASGDEESQGGRDEKTDKGEKGDKGDAESSGRDNPSGHDSSSSSGREGWSSSGEEDPAKHDGSSSGRDDSSSEYDGSSSGHRPPTGPTGHVKTGVGGSVRSDTTQIAAGAGVLAVAAVGGAWLLRRRASGTQGAG